MGQVGRGVVVGCVCVRANTCAYAHAPFPPGHSSNSVLTSLYKIV